jgi:ketopantoate reductase
MSEEKQDLPPQLLNAFIQSFCEVWQPADVPEHDTELKTTSEIIDELEPVYSVGVNELSEALQQAGFKIHYTGEGFFWMLRKNLQTNRILTFLYRDPQKEFPE